LWNSGLHCREEFQQRGDTAAEQAQRLEPFPGRAREGEQRAGFLKNIATKL